MYIKYEAEINKEAVKINLKRLTNQIYKLLPTREEGLDWEKPLTTIIEEFAGMYRLLTDHHIAFFSLLCKLEGLFTIDDNTQIKDAEKFFIFRKTIFECLNLVNDLVVKCS